MRVMVQLGGTAPGVKESKEESWKAARITSLDWWGGQVNQVVTEEEDKDNALHKRVSPDKVLSRSNFLKGRPRMNIIIDLAEFSGESQEVTVCQEMTLKEVEREAFAQLALHSPQDVLKWSWGGHRVSPHSTLLDHEIEEAAVLHAERVSDNRDPIVAWT